MLRYRFLRVLRNRGDMFWTLVYPIILTTLMYVAFGNLGTDSWQNIPVAVIRGNVTESSDAPGLSQMLELLDGELIEIRDMTETEAMGALAEGEITGIFYTGGNRSLTVGGNGMRETMLAMLLETYEENGRMFEEVYEEYPERIEEVSALFAEEAVFLRDTTLGGKTFDFTLEYFFGCLAMAAFFGTFMGMQLAEDSAANLSALAARRSVAPEHKAKSLLRDMAVCLVVQFVNVTLLLFYMQYVLRISFSGNLTRTLLICLTGSLTGIAFGMFVGASGLPKGVKMGLNIGVPLLCCFGAGLMYGGMKHVIEKKFPLLNRLNPAALMSDALYYLNVYDDLNMMWRKLLILVVIAAVLTLLALLSLKRTRYESI